MFNFKGEVISLFDNSIKQDIVKNKKKSTLVSSANLLRNHNSLFASLRLKKKKAGSGSRRGIIKTFGIADKHVAGDSSKLIPLIKLPVNLINKFL